ncbi:MAG: PQQ-binding-like beta-propeller repeat protein [Verrucomicrobiota bacterium]
MKKLIILLATVSVAFAGDAPQWGGTPENNMVTSETNLPLDFDGGKKKRGTDEIDMTTTKNVKWVAKVGSSTYGTPTIGEGKVIVGTNNESPRNEAIVGDRGVVMCFDEETGEFLWQLTVPKLGAGKVSDWEYLGICSSATIEDGRCYIITNRCEVICLDMDGMADGNDGPFEDEGQYMAEEGKPPVAVGDTDADIIWVYDMREELSVFPHNVASSSILKIGNELFVTTSNGVDWSHVNVPIPDAPALIKLDAETGELTGEEDAFDGNTIMHCNWSTPTQGVIDGKPVVIFGAGDGFTYCFSTETEPNEDGFDILKMIWSVDCNPPEYRHDEDGKPIKYATYEGPSEIISTPVVYKDKVYVCIGQDPEHGEGVGMMTCIDLKTGKPLWTYKDIERSISTPSVLDDIVYVADYRGQVHAVDANTGEPFWVFDTKSHIWSSTLVGDGKVYIPNEDGEVIILATGKEMKEIGRVEFSAPIYTSAVAANGVLYVASMTHLFAFKKGAETAAN